MKDYYGVKDIMLLTGSCRSTCYEILKTLISKFQKEFPDAISINGKIPIWYFEEKMKNKK